MPDNASSSQNRTNLQTTFTDVAEAICTEIHTHGPVCFARFMEMALYCPDCGFYDKESDTVGRRGHFYTSVSVGSLFGEFLAFQFANWLEALSPQPQTFNLIEAGAHDGNLALDILTWLKRQRPQVFERIEYIIIEPSSNRRDRQRQTLESFATNVRWIDSLPGHGMHGETSAFSLQPSALKFNGILFSNELLDAMPVHRFGWDAKKREWFEWGVTVDANRFVWARLQGAIIASQFSLPASSELLDVLPGGYTIETSPAATQWWKNAANALDHGKLLTFDYGFTRDEWLSPGRRDGTLRAYRRHRVMDDVLANPGEQDITAHINFTEIQSAGETAGLRTETFQTQAKFLTDVASRAWLAGSGFGDWLPEHSRQFQTLTHPEHLGRAFRVLVQSR